MLRNKNVWLAVSILLASSTSASQSGCLERTIPVSIAGHDGTPAPALTSTNLEGTYEKKPVVIKLVELEDKPPRVILLVDTSGSIQSRADATIDVAEEVLSRLPPDAAVGLAFFAEKTIPVALPQADHQKLIFQPEALRKDRRSYRGKTALWSALMESEKMFKTSRVGDSIYLISDAGENKSLERERTVETALGSAGIRLFAFIISPAVILRSAPEELSGPFEVQKIVDSTGGTSVVTNEPSNPFPVRAVFVGKNGQMTWLGETLSQQLDQLLKFYRVEITLPEAVDKPRGWKLKLAEPSRVHDARLQLTYPGLLAPCR